MFKFNLSDSKHKRVAKHNLVFTKYVGTTANMLTSWEHTSTSQSQKVSFNFHSTVPLIPPSICCHEHTLFH